MPSVLCPSIVGRDEEWARLVARVDTLVHDGVGGVVVLRGDAGLGKSRLARETAQYAAAARLQVLTGRAVPGTSPTPYRPFTEAFLALNRSGVRPAGSELTGFDTAVGRLVPGWGGPGGGGADASPLIVGEAVVRLLRAVRPRTSAGTLLVLEDLHWAETETAAAIEHLVGVLAEERTLCLVTTRAEPAPVTSVIERARTRVEVVDLASLAPQHQRDMVLACLGHDAPAGLSEFVLAHSDGVPFVVEELLAGLVGDGTLDARDGGWTLTGELTPSVPASLRDSVLARLRTLPPAAGTVLAAAAVLGRRFDWALVPGVAGVDAAEVAAVLRAALATQLILVAGQEFRFRHALTREVVLGELLPFERAQLSRRALAAIELAHPGLPETWCGLAAELAEVAGDSSRAATLLTEVARRSTARGAYASAVSAAERACASAGPHTAAHVDATEALVTVLAASGDVRRARELGTALLDRMDRTDPARVVELQILLTRAAVEAGDKATARTLLHAARHTASGDLLSLRLDALAATVALDAEDIATARRLAHRVLGRARELGAAEVECEALDVLGRTEWAGDGELARAYAEHILSVAERHGLGAWRIRALQQIALAATLTGGMAELASVRPAMLAAGAFSAVAQLDLIAADLSLGQLEADQCEEAARTCIELSRRFGLATLPVALLWLAGAHALRLDGASMEQAIADAIGIDPADERIVADAWGRVRATYHSLREDRPELRAALDTSMRLVRTAPPTRSVYGGRALHLLLHVLDDDDLAVAARADFEDSTMRPMPSGQVVAAAADAIAAGRRGDREKAAELLAEARRWGENGALGYRAHMYALRLTAEAAVRDGWGEPVPLLRELEAHFAGRGYDRVARACRVLLTEAGAPAPRRGRGDSVVPERWRARGVTSREFDVWQQLPTGATNKQIAERLVLSVRTVENHVASLLRRTGAASRNELAALLTG